MRSHNLSLNTSRIKGRFTKTLTKEATPVKKMMQSICSFVWRSGFRSEQHMHMHPMRDREHDKKNRRRTLARVEARKKTKTTTISVQQAQKQSISFFFSGPLHTVVVSVCVRVCTYRLGPDTCAHKDKELRDNFAVQSFVPVDQQPEAKEEHKQVKC
jgi:hypothetical protein